MDKLRAIEVFVAAAEAKSFSAAARRLEVSIPAVAKMVNALERTMDVRLFVRNAQGLSLTADGEKYLEACHRVLEQVAAADESIGGAIQRAKGTLVVAAMPQLAIHCLVPALPAFHQRYPDIHLDLRCINRLDDADAHGADAYVVMGWPDKGDLVHRRIAETRQLVCASPAYWARHGIPQHPSELARHTCFCFRNPEGTVIDLWRFDKDGEEVRVAVSGWLSSNHRDVNLDAVIAGEGVARVSDLSARAALASGRIVPVLMEWAMRDSPPVNLLTRAIHRRTTRVRVFTEFVTDLFSALGNERGLEVFVTRDDRPDWYGRRFGHVSSTWRHRRPD